MEGNSDSHVYNTNKHSNTSNQQPQPQQQQQQQQQQPVNPRRVYVGNLSFGTHSDELRQVISQVGPVSSVTILRDGHGRSKGCAVVEFVHAEDAVRAIRELHDHELRGRKMFLREDRVGPSESTAAAAAPPVPMAASAGHEAARVFVYNLSWGTTWQELKDHFKPHGKVIRSDILRRPDGTSKGCGIVVFDSVESARAAVQALNGSNLNDRAISVDFDKRPTHPQQHQHTTMGI